MYRPILTIPLIGALTLLIFLMGWFSVQMIQMEKAEALRVQQEEYENKLSLTLWQLETSALTIYNDCVAELTSAKQNKVYTGEEFFINNTITTSDLELPDKNEWSAERVLKYELCTNAHILPPPTTQKPGLKEPLSLRSTPVSKVNSNDEEKQELAVTPNSNPNWSGIQNSSSIEKQSYDYATRADTTRKSKIAYKNALDNSYNQRIQNENPTESNIPINTTLAAVVDSTPFQVYWVKDKLYLLRNLENQIHAVTLNHQVIEDQLLEGVPHLLIESCNHTYVKVENSLLKIIPASDLPFRKNALVTLPYNITMPFPAAPQLEKRRYLNLGITWAALIVCILLAVAFIASLIRLSNRRSQFVSSVTHELRTPLTSFQLYSEMLRDGLVPSEEKRASYLDTLYLESKRLSHLVENVLSYSQLERGKVTRVEVELSELLPPIIDRLRSRSEQAGAALTVEQLASSDARVRTDPTAIEQILFNLVDNACKYGLTSDKRLDLSITESPSNLQFHLKDYGTGIPKDLHRTLFKPFHKSVKTAADTQKPGVGLGLSIARRQARLLGGDLTLKSNCKQGACFTLTIKK